MIHKFTLALYDPSKGKHESHSWDCNFSNAQSIFNIAINAMKRKLVKFPDSKVVVVKIDEEISYLKV